MSWFSLLHESWDVFVLQRQILQDWEEVGNVVRLEWKILVHKDFFVWEDGLLNLILLLSFSASLSSTILLLENIIWKLLLHLVWFIFKNEFLFFIQIAFEVNDNSNSKANITECRDFVIRAFHSLKLSNLLRELIVTISFFSKALDLLIQLFRGERESFRNGWLAYIHWNLWIHENLTCLKNNILIRRLEE